MPKRLLGADPITGMRTYHEYDHMEKKTVITYEHSDVQPVLDWAHDLATSGIDDYNRKKDMRHYAYIPESIALKWWVEEGISTLKPEHLPRIIKKLNDPEYARLRTGKGWI